MASQQAQEMGDPQDGLTNATAPSQHEPNLAGSVVTADGVGGEKIGT
jgi:hypothetical protein